MNNSYDHFQIFADATVYDEGMLENTVGKEMRDINESSDGVKRSALIIFDKFKIKCSDLLTIIEV